MPVPLPWNSKNSFIAQPEGLDIEELRRRNFGRTNPDRMENPLWEYFVRSHEDPWHFENRHGIKREWPPEPEANATWTFNRHGMTTTIIGDSFLVSIGGGYDRAGDSNFLIYNDVIVRDTNGNVWIYGYPRSEFPPTDFHTATLITDGSLYRSISSQSIVIIGSIGYPEDLDWWTTPVYHLDLGDFLIKRIETTGEGPGWISQHSASLQLIPTHNPSHPDYKFSIDIRGGKILGEDARMRPNLQEFSLDLSTLVWSKS